MKRIIVLFKTHLDIGFTDLGSAVIEKYNNKYIPKAISVAEEIACSGRKEGFVWTTGSWLIYQYLQTACEEEKGRLVNAVKKGWLSWHGLPFTFHSEVASAQLFNYGLSMSRELDKRFGRKTIGAKMTDVPGHTKAIVPHLEKAGIKLLHIGINPASTAADVPPLFRWQFAKSEIVVMYNSGDYGEFTHIPGTQDYIFFAHTGDNLGPQSAEEIYSVYDNLNADYPDYEIIAGDLNTVAQSVVKIKDTLPIVTSEIGDSWIHGAGTDPQKLSQYKALLRLADTLSNEEKRKVYSNLLFVPEHTWGLDEKTHLKENKNYIRPLFDRVRNNYNFKKMELSWAEQRKYLLDGAAEITDRALAESALNEFAADEPDWQSLIKITGRKAVLSDMKIEFAEHGEIKSLAYGGKVYADNDHTLFGFSYDEYSYDDVYRFDRQYLKKRFIEEFEKTGKANWAIEDFGKFGLELEKVANNHIRYTPDGIRLYSDEKSIYVQYALDSNLVEKHGLPRRMALVITPEDEKILFDLRWFGKEANRAPEALWLYFNTVKPLTGISKLGFIIDPNDVVSHGGRGLHATDGTLKFEDISLKLMDSALVSVGKKNVYNFDNELPDLTNGVYLNLFNNQWGTNFPMWNEGNARFRFILS